MELNNISFQLLNEGAAVWTSFYSSFFSPKWLISVAGMPEAANSLTLSPVGTAGDATGSD
ncbi:hypothetical protein [Thalassovita taeanensis]|uniref:hypothetical protein n=1 Tax=Thalassovita taeanensis TaxID=657014 RepID=UPI001114E90D|nr:hypothetical protein [Thalassovita taeanensis]